MFDELPVVAQERDTTSPVETDESEWPWHIPAVRDLLADRRELSRHGGYTRRDHPRSRRPGPARDKLG